MLNSAACRTKTARAPAEAPACEMSSRDMGLTHGHRASYRRADETSRYAFEWRAAAFSRRRQAHDCTMPSRLALLWSGERRPAMLQMPTAANSDAIYQSSRSCRNCSQPMSISSGQQISGIERIVVQEEWVRHESN